MAARNLSACLPVTLAYEGGLSMIRSDPGNWTGGKVGIGELRGTNMGIAASSHPALDIAHLSKAEAAAIYDREYWTPAGCETLPSGLDLSHFDGTVNSGPGNSAKWLAAATPAVAVQTSIHAYAAARLRSVQSFKTWITFGKGWAARIAGVEAKSITMALGSAAPAVIASAADKASAHAAAATVSTNVGTGAAVISIATAVHAHPIVGGLAALASIAWSILSAFVAHGSATRATALRTAATS